ncbi:hypothetical protein ACQEU5_24425 [Marinactinospora thermotolerans]|uniref:hypothetical protein n=1 Tax=Marinactinospora thermotolerans TaxID=531310 RepID=UPI003D920A38
MDGETGETCETAWEDLDDDELLDRAARLIQREPLHPGVVGLVEAIRRVGMERGGDTGRS